MNNPMETNQPEKANQNRGSRSDAVSGSAHPKELIEVTLRGGTKLRMDAGRSETSPYDLLLKTMKHMQIWSEDEQCWLPDPKWLIAAQVISAPNVGDHSRRELERNKP